MPDKVCFTCNNELQRVFLFKQKCEQSDLTLRAYLEKNSSTGATTELPQIGIRIDDVKTVDGTFNYIKEKQTENNAKIFTKENDAIKNLAAQKEELKQDDQPADQNWQCSFCLTGFDSDARLKLHLLDDHSAIQCKEEIIDEPFTGDEDGCETLENVCFINQDELIIKHEIDEEEPLDTFVDASNTSVDASFQCDICKKKFSQKTYIERHIMRCHMPSKCYGCKLCSLCKCF